MPDIMWQNKRKNIHKLSENSTEANVPITNRFVILANEIGTDTTAKVKLQKNI